MKIAVAGKGGTGKTTTACLLLGALRRSGGSILAVDADPNACLGEYLGLDVDMTLGQIRDDTLARKDSQPAGMSKAQVIEYEMHRALIEAKGFDLLTMGRTEGAGCYCYVNNLLRGFMADLEENYNTLLIDNEAGLEHLSRRTSRDVDVLAVVADRSRASRTAARRIVALVDELDIRVGRKVLIQNRSNDATVEPLPGLEVVGAIPPDGEVEGLDESGRSLLDLPADSPASRAAERILEKLNS